MLEIVSEPDMHTIEQVRAYTRGLRMLLQYLGVNSGDLEKGVIRFEANVSVRPVDQNELGTRTEIKNLNSFRTMTAAIAYELDRQTDLLEAGRKIAQETLGWDEENQITISQRSKEEAHDYRYFPEPDLPPLVISREQIEAARAILPERPDRRCRRFVSDLGLGTYQAELLTGDKATADFYEAVLGEMTQPDAVLATNWFLGELFGLINERAETIDSLPITPQNLAVLLGELQIETVNTATAKAVLAEMVGTGKDPIDIIHDSGMQQISDREALAQVVTNILAEYPDEVQDYRNGKTALKQWFFGQVMRRTKGQANPAIVQSLLDKLL